MRTDYLRYFIDTVTLGSMNAAARKNFMTPQGISRSITALESELGCELFQRDSNSVSLTHFGKLLLEDARALLAHEGSMRRTIQQLQSDSLHKREISVTCYCEPLFFESTLLFPVSGLGFSHYGKVELIQQDAPETVAALEDAAHAAHPNAVTAGLFAFYSTFPEENTHLIDRLSGAGYEYLPLLQTPLLVLVPAYTSIAREPSVSAESLASFPLAIPAHGGMRRAIAATLGKDIRIYACACDSAYRAHLCRMAEALTFIPGTSLAFDPPEGTDVVPLEQPLSVEIGVAAHADTLREGPLADTLERLRRFYGKHEHNGHYQLLEGFQA